MKVFNSGTVAMDVNLEKTGFFQGEGLKVMACIQNNSSRPIKLKYCFYRKHTFLAKGNRKVSTKDLLKEVGEPIPPSAEEKFTRVIPIPSDVEPSIENCSIIKVEYRLRLYLDVKYASDPEIKFPIVILPAARVPAASGFGFESTEPLAWGFEPPAEPTAPAAPAPSGMTIKNFSIEYDAINSRNTFTDGDTVNGRIVVEASKETRIQSLVFTAKGKARVKWTEYHGNHNYRVYWAEERYYDVKHILREAKRDGEALQVTVEVNNRSTRSVKPKFVLYEKKSFFAQGRRRVGTHEILKQKMESIAPGKETVTTVIPIPRELPPSILNCSILKQEYRLKVNFLEYYYIYIFI
ncbi:Arrestin domain-containing protein 3 [Liparis tanakae]|uniref:Arrestin domain-containing protein 3 n=1 Tax=Liparis tanakae TaxID=230148 RepID=A0A4Z2ESN0_9TELE|nr:Arrestin domain-containing protein 3 [Liparis tanakae]